MIKRLLLCIVPVFFLQNIAVAQWVNVAPNLLGNFPSDCCGFGAFAYKDSVAWAGRTALWRSLDKGATWTQVSVSVNGAISQIDFFDKNTGVFICDNGSVSLTTDQGKSWLPIHSGGEGVGVSFCGSPNIIYVASDYNGLFYTTDQGKTWTQSSTGGHVLCCIGKKDGSALVHNSGMIRRTTDGNSYQTLGTVDYDGWSMAFDSSGENTIYFMNEEFHIPTDGMSSVFRSTDGGTSWTDFEKHSGTYFSGSIVTSKNAVYAQTLSNGIFKSTDKGQTWFSICGPSNNVDSRTLCAISDSILLAADANGSVWRLTSPPASTSSNLKFSISTTSRINEDTLGADILVPMYLKANIAMPSFDMIVNWNPGQLKYIRSFTINSKSLDVPGQMWSGRAKIHFDAADLATRRDSLIGYSVFHQMPGDAACSPVFFDSAIVITAGGGPCDAASIIIAPTAQTIIGAPRQPDVSFSITSRRIITDSLNITVRLPIYLHTIAAMPAFDMIIHYPGGSLTYQKSLSLAGNAIDVPGGAWAGRAAVHFSAADLSARKDSLIGWSLFNWMPYEFDCAHITFDSMTVNMTANPCAAKGNILDSSTEGIIGSYPSCGLAKETDVDPPRFTLFQNKNATIDSIQFDDARPTDEGLRSIWWIAESGTDTNKIKVLGIFPRILACYNDKQSHSVKLVQLDTNAGGCYDFTFTDCLGHQSYTKLCIASRTQALTPALCQRERELEVHPNPFSHRTTFTYTVADYGGVKLYLFDELGREVAKIIDGIVSSGTYSIDFDASKLASGNYIARMETDGNVISRRVIIEK